MLSITEPQDPENFPHYYATTKDEWTEAAFNINHPAVSEDNPLYMFVQCEYCGKIVAKNRRIMRRNINHRHIIRVFCNKTCSWAFYRNIEFEGKRHPIDYVALTIAYEANKKYLREIRRERIFRLIAEGKMGPKSRKSWKEAHQTIDDNQETSTDENQTQPPTSPT